MNYFAVKGVNEDTHGYDFISYVWKGARQIGQNKFEIVQLEGEEGISAHIAAKTNKILLPEDCTTTGGVAIGYGGASGGWARNNGKGLADMVGGTPPARAKKSKKKNKDSDVLLGDED